MIGSRIENPAVGGIDCKIGETGVRINEFDVGPALSAVAGLVDSALLVWAEQVPQYRDVDSVVVFWIDDDSGYGLSFFQTHIREGFAAVRRFVDSVAPG